jgi:hypothetical protein
MQDQPETFDESKARRAQIPQCAKPIEVDKARSPRTAGIELSIEVCVDPHHMRLTYRHSAARTERK